ncbi:MULTISPECIES: hypothetical protein [Streptomyces]|uniref:Uncharacterized protein n=1 Tax=Streptomyces cacaoi TaxID=1898 RepID=A0A4Y3QXS3_STRCI|nr:MULTISPECIES: hypothetical protein [Streptomyces]GEB50194.1 hypothetical protein SCA03_27450 [Streptomyces cacaoi]
MSTPVDAEQAWQELQRIRVPQERVYDEVERNASGGPGAIYSTGALMWVFLAVLGMDPPRWVIWPVLTVYIAVLAVLVVWHNRRSRLRLHRSRYTWRTTAVFLAAGALTGASVLLTARLVDGLEPLLAGPLHATVSVAAFLLFAGPAGRWAAGSVRESGEPAVPGGAGR